MGDVICTNIQDHGKVFHMTSLTFEWCGSDKLQFHHVNLVWVTQPFFPYVISYSMLQNLPLSLHLQLHNHALNSLSVFIHQIAVDCADFLIFPQSYFKHSAGTVSIFRLHFLLSSLVSAPREGDSSSRQCRVRENHCLFLFFGVWFTRDILLQIDFASDHSSGSGKTFRWKCGVWQVAIWIVGTSLIFAF